MSRQFFGEFVSKFRGMLALQQWNCINTLVIKVLVLSFSKAECLLHYMRVLYKHV
jgi:hypothetical protein